MVIVRMEERAGMGSAWVGPVRFATSGDYSVKENDVGILM
jgi:hypothetical protein